jgi:predicted NUDIX family NTP pyrophosphohydrolase
VSAVSAGILLFRRRDGALEVLIGHPGGPFWRRKAYGSWSVPKGLAEPGEPIEAVAEREFAEEVGFAVADVAVDPSRAPIDLGEVTLRSRKVIRAWAIEGDLDPALAHSNEIDIEWPPRSGRTMTIPEVDEVSWFGLDEAGRRLHPIQAAFLERLVVALDGRSG